MLDKLVSHEVGYQAGWPAIYAIEETENLAFPYISMPVKAGFPSAQDFMEEDIDLVAFLGMNQTSLYIVRVDGNSMEDLVVDKSLKPRPHAIVVAVLNGEFTIKTW